ncbi:putative cytochrome P450 YjiB [Ktedonobacteria bacterium brp13]|nr:putative cytochrome P450 YjiB [Ktedonobacteria bacterium brp13]
MAIQDKSELPRNMMQQKIGDSVESRITWYREMRENQPVHYNQDLQVWEVFRYKDVQRVLLDHVDYSVKKTLPENFPSTLGKSEPPRHRQLRSLVSKAFTPRSIEELTPRLVEIIDSLLEPALAIGKMEMMTGLTYPLPVRVIAEMLGLPAKDQERFRVWSYQLLDQFTKGAHPDNNELFHYFSDLLEERKADPQTDLMSSLLAAEEDGARLTREEILFMCLEMMMAGNVTTTMLLSYALDRFSQHPEIYEALRADPSLIPGALEETLRYDFSEISLRRTAREDLVLDGHEIKAGEMIVSWVGAAHFEEEYFPHAEQFDIRRTPNPHMTFGYGIHVCLGAPLARLESKIALERIVAHFSSIHPDPERPLSRKNGHLHQLGLLFTPVHMPVAE